MLQNKSTNAVSKSVLDHYVSKDEHFGIQQKEGLSMEMRPRITA